MRRKWMSAAAAALLAAGLVCGCANPQKEGVEALEEGNYEEAEARFSELTEKGGKEGAAGYRGLGMVYYETEEYQKALEAFETAAESGIRPDVQMYNLMGVCAMQTEDYASALEYIQSGLALTSTSDGADKADAELVQEMKYNEIICYEQQADWENAKQKVTEYLEDYPDDETVQKEAEFLETR